MMKESSTLCSITDGMIEQGGVLETRARLERLLIAVGDSAKIAPCTKSSIDSASSKAGTACGPGWSTAWSRIL